MIIGYDSNAYTEGLAHRKVQVLLAHRNRVAFGFLDQAGEIVDPRRSDGCIPGHFTHRVTAVDRVDHGEFHRMGAENRRSFAQNAAAFERTNRTPFAKSFFSGIEA